MIMVSWKTKGRLNLRSDHSTWEQRRKIMKDCRERMQPWRYFQLGRWASVQKFYGPIIFEVMRSSTVCTFRSIHPISIGITIRSKSNTQWHLYYLQLQYPPLSVFLSQNQCIQKCNLFLIREDFAFKLLATFSKFKGMSLRNHLYRFRL